MQKFISSLMMGLFTVGAVAAVANAAEWGSLKGRIVVSGTPAKLPAPVINKDPEFCGAQHVTNNAVVVGKDNGLVNAVVFLRAVDAAGSPIKIDIHPDYADLLKQPVVLDNKGCSFHPHVVTVRVGQKLVVKNSDPVGHNTNLTLLGQNPIVPANDKAEYTVNKSASVPMPVQCNIHAWMLAHMLSLDHPYMAVSGEDGRFEIKNIPAGTHEFQFWQEAPGNLKKLSFKGGTTDARGRTKIKIEAGKTVDIGDLKVPASVLVPK